MWISYKSSLINLDNVRAIGLCSEYVHSTHGNPGWIVIFFSDERHGTYNCESEDCAKDIIKQIFSAIYDGKKVFNMSLRISEWHKRYDKGEEDNG